MAAVDKLLVLKVASALGCGLMAGVFFAFSAFVMRALGRLSLDRICPPLKSQASKR